MKTLKQSEKKIQDLAYSRMFKKKDNRTVHKYELDVLDFIFFSNLEIRADLKKVKKSDVKAWHDYLKLRDVHPNRIKRKLEALFLFFDHLCNIGFKLNNPVLDILEMENSDNKQMC